MKLVDLLEVKAASIGAIVEELLDKYGLEYTKFDEKKVGIDIEFEMYEVEKHMSDFHRFSKDVVALPEVKDFVQRQHDVWRVELRNKK